MKRPILLILILLGCITSLMGQGKFFGGNGTGYTCMAVRDTLQCTTTTASLNAQGCNSATVNGQTYTTAGSYVQTLTNSFGCDSLLTVNVILNQLDTAVTTNGSTLTANATGTYQWLSCDGGMVPVLGETNQSFSPGSTGNYAVVVSDGTCSDTSGCHYVLIISRLDPQLAGCEAFPNPSKGAFSIRTPYPDTECTLVDLTGRILATYRPMAGVPLQVHADLPAGVYQLYFCRATMGSQVVRLLMLE